MKDLLRFLRRTPLAIIDQDCCLPNNLENYDIAIETEVLQGCKDNPMNTIPQVSMFAVRWLLAALTAVSPLAPAAVRADDVVTQSFSNEPRHFNFTVTWNRTSNEWSVTLVRPGWNVTGGAVSNTYTDERGIVETDNGLATMGIDDPAQGGYRSGTVYVRLLFQDRPSAGNPTFFAKRGQLLSSYCELAQGGTRNCSSWEPGGDVKQWR